MQGTPVLNTRSAEVDSAMPSAPDRPTAYLWCPAYALADQAQVERTRASAQRFAAAIGHSLIESPSLPRCGVIGSWPAPTERLAELEQALTHDLILAARGGYGCVDLVGALLDPARRLPRLVGYSDLTVLHACWSVRGGPETYYGFMPAAPCGERALSTAAALVRGEGLGLSAAGYPEATPVRAGEATGPLVPACLRVLASVCGTPAMPALAGTILALEDIDERPYRVDRDLAQLQLAGALDGVRALVFGTLRFQAPAGYAGPSALEICRRWGDRLGVPTLYGLPFGHEPDPVTLPWGRPATIGIGGADWRLDIAAAR